MRNLGNTLLALMLLAGFSAMRPDNQTETIRLGVTIPLSVPYATYGSTIQDGVELAKRDLESAGYSVEVFYEDVPLPGPGAVSAIRKLVTENKIHGLAANFLNPAIPVMAPIIEQNRILSFHTAEADDRILNSGQYIFTTNARIRDEAQRAAAYAIESFSGRRAAVLLSRLRLGKTMQNISRSTTRLLVGRSCYMKRHSLIK